MTKQTPFQKRQAHRAAALASVQSLCEALTNGRFGRNLDGSANLAFQVGYLQGVIANIVADTSPAKRAELLSMINQYTASQETV